jgi:hypothetical protein
MPTVEASLRCVSWLWQETFQPNPFGTDGPKTLLPQWPGDSLKNCRQWHGIDVAFENQVEPGTEIFTIKRDSIVVSSPDYVGITEYCSIKGRGYMVDRFNPEHGASNYRIGSNPRGEYIEIQSMMSSRLGVLLPDVDIGMSHTTNPGGTSTNNPLAYINAFFLHFVEEGAEYYTANEFTGSNNNFPKIYSNILLRIFADGYREGLFVSDTGGNGFKTMDEIIANQIGFSWIPEHHLYLDGAWITGKEVNHPNKSKRLTDWIDTNWPYEAFGFSVVNQNLIEWCQNASAQDKKALSEKFKADYPGYFVD